MQIVDDRDYDILELEDFDGPDIPRAVGPSAEDQWTMQSNPAFISEFMNKQREAEKERKKELTRRRARAIVEYEDFVRTNDRYWHSLDNLETMFDSIKNLRRTMPVFDYTTECFSKVYQKLVEREMLDLGPNRGYSRAEIDVMDAGTYRDAISHPLRGTMKAEKEEAEVARTRPEFKPSPSDQREVWEVAQRNGKISLAGLMTLFPGLTREQVSILADSVPGLKSAGVGNRKTWWRV